MTRESRDARQDRAIVALLQALPEDRLAHVLAEVGIEQEKRDQAAKAADPRRCDVCGLGYVRCRAADPLNDHSWTPIVPRQRA